MCVAPLGVGPLLRGISARRGSGMGLRIANLGGDTHWEKGKGEEKPKSHKLCMTFCKKGHVDCLKMFEIQCISCIWGNQNLYI